MLNGPLLPKLLGPTTKKLGIHRFIVADHVASPTGVFVVRMVAAGHMVHAGKGMSNQDGVGFIGIERAIGFGNQIKTQQRVDVLQGKGLFECNGLRGNDAHESGWVNKSESWLEWLISIDNSGWDGEIHGGLKRRLPESAASTKLKVLSVFR